MTVVTLFALAGFQVTGETSGVRLLGRIGGALIEIDRWIPAHKDNIDLLSRDRPNAPLELPDLPIDVAIEAPQTLGESEASLNAAITRSMGVTLYNEGSGAVRDESGESHLGVTEPTRWAIDLLTEDAHSFWRMSLIVTGLSLITLCIGMIWTRQSPLTALASGGAVAAALSLGVWLVAMAAYASVDGAINREIALVVRDGAWMGLRNGLAVLGIGVAASFVVSTLFPQRREDRWEDWRTFDSSEPDPPPY